VIRAQRKLTGFPQSNPAIAQWHSSPPLPDRGLLPYLTLDSSGCAIAFLKGFCPVFTAFGDLLAKDSGW
jgi:hypothetical protein